MDLTESTKNFKPLISMYLKLYLKSIDLKLRHLKSKSKSKFKFPNATLILLAYLALMVDDLVLPSMTELNFFFATKISHLIASTSPAYGLVLLFLNATSTIFYDFLWLQKWWMNLCVLLCVDVRDYGLKFLNVVLTAF